MEGKGKKKILRINKGQYESNVLVKLPASDAAGRNLHTCNVHTCSTHTHKHTMPLKTANMRYILCHAAVRVLQTGFSSVLVTSLIFCR